MSKGTSEERLAACPSWAVQLASALYDETIDETGADDPAFSWKALAGMAEMLVKADAGLRAKLVEAEKDRDEARAELDRLQRTVDFQVQAYLAEHENWGVCKWKAALAEEREKREKLLAALGKAASLMLRENAALGMHGAASVGLVRVALRVGAGEIDKLLMEHKTIKPALALFPESE